MSACNFNIELLPVNETKVQVAKSVKLVQLENGDTAVVLEATPETKSEGTPVLDLNTVGKIKRETPATLEEGKQTSVQMYTQPWGQYTNVSTSSRNGRSSPFTSTAATHVLGDLKKMILEKRKLEGLEVIDLEKEEEEKRKFIENQELSASEIEKQRKRLEQNRISAKRFRSKKRKVQEHTQKKVKELLAYQRRLHASLFALETQKEMLEKAWKATNEGTTCLCRNELVDRIFGTSGQLFEVPTKQLGKTLKNSVKDINFEITASDKQQQSHSGSEIDVGTSIERSGSKRKANEDFVYINGIKYVKVEKLPISSGEINDVLKPAIIDMPVIENETKSQSTSCIENSSPANISGTSEEGRQKIKHCLSTLKSKINTNEQMQKQVNGENKLSDTSKLSYESETLTTRNKVNDDYLRNTTASVLVEVLTEQNYDTEDEKGEYTELTDSDVDIGGISTTDGDYIITANIDSDLDDTKRDSSDVDNDDVIWIPPEAPLVIDLTA